MNTRSGPTRIGRARAIGSMAAASIVVMLAGPTVAGAADAEPPPTAPPITAPPITQASSFEPGGPTATVPDELAPAGPVIDNGPIVTDASSFEPGGPSAAGTPDPLGPTLTPSGAAEAPTALAYTGGAEAVIALVGLGLIGLGSTTCRFAAKRGAET